MKKNTFFFLLLIILHHAHSQCTIENEDQTLIGATTGNSGQSFTPTCNGILDNIEVVATFSTLVTVTLRSGEGYSGTIIGTLSNQSTSPSGNPITFTEFDFSSLNIILIAGQSYTFDVSSEINLIYDNDDALDYVDGQRYQNGSAQVGTDLLFNVNLTAIPCTDPDVPMVTHSPTTICNGESTTLTINGNLNDATEWHIYTGSCGGTEIGTTTSSTFVVTPSAANTTYFVRGEGGLCVVPGSCGTTNVVVTPDDVVTFTAPADLCINAGIQTGLSGGSPSGGTYSGNGVTDDGNGSTYSFNPTTAGTGTHTITYTSSGTCSSSASDSIEVFELPTVSFTAPTDLCIDAGIQTGLGGGTPSGGTYSGNGVTDDGNGTTYSFNPTTAGTGNQNITYSFTNANGCTDTASDTVEVFNIPTVSFTAPADLCIDTGIQTGLGGGTPSGGMYSGNGVTDDGNGTTYSFNPTTAGTGNQNITYSFTNANGCSNTASDTVEVFNIPTVSFTAPADLCIDAGIQTGLGGGTPSGGMYSGNGVTDDGNGTTYSFNPTTAGTGNQNITYSFTNANGCSNTASDTVEVFNIPTVSFTAPTDLCIDAGIQTGLGGGTPSGGTYSGNGVTDDGNGTTYSFNPTTAGTGNQNITYSFTNANGCTDTASDTVEVFELPTVSFTAPADLCIDAGIQTGLGGGTPSGGMYSGNGVTDDGNGTTYSFNPTTAGTGNQNITYSFTNANGCSNTASDTVEVFNIPTVSFTAPADLCIDAGIQTGLGGGTPSGGMYSGNGVTDDGNGTTYSFNPTTAGTGNQNITYSFTNVNGCTDTASDTVEVFNIPTVSFTAPADLCIDAGIQTGLGGGTPSGGTYSGNGVTDDGNGTTYSFNPTTAGTGNQNITYSFTNVNGCTDTASDTVEVLELPDSSVDDSLSPTLTATTSGATYQWINCDNNTPLSGETNQSFTATQDGNYAVDITLNGCTQRSSCYLIASLSNEDEELITDKLQVYPIPTSGPLNISITIKKAVIYDITGKKVFETRNTIFDISELNSGVYFMNIEGEKGNTIKQIIKN